jgi:hypothetical protein
MNKLFATLALPFLIAATYPANASRVFASPVMARPNLSAGMIQFVSKEGEFSVKLPAEPQPNSQVVDTAVGKVTMHYFSVETNSGNNAYMVIYADYPTVPSDPATTVDNAVNGQADSVKGKIIEVKKVTLNGWPGKTARIENADTTYLTAAYMAENRLYQLIFVTPKGETIPSDVAEFFASFQITKSAPAK